MDKETMRKNGCYRRIWNIFGMIGVLTVILMVCTAVWIIWQPLAALRKRNRGAESAGESRSEWHAVNGQLSSEARQDWIEQKVAEVQGVTQLGIIAEDTSEVFEINLAEDSNLEMSFVQIMGEKLQISGRKDTGRGYFEGKIAWYGQEICIVNFDTAEYAVLKEDIRSFMLGDYYISCRSDREAGEMELLIFYCP